jgi:hypothetical protein
MPLEAALLKPNDDVATALADLRAGSVVRLAQGDTVREVRLTEPIPLGFKFAVRDLGDGLRVRKYGEYIGRLTGDVRAGARVHDHNLETGAQRHPDHERAWCVRVTPRVRALGDAGTSVG